MRMQVDAQTSDGREHRRRLRLATAVTTLVALVVFAGLVTAGQAESERAIAAGRADVAKDFIGTWTLKSTYMVDSEGDRLPFYEDPIGTLTYTPTGDVWALTGERGGEGIWYMGTFDVRPRTRTVVHRVEYSSIADWEGDNLIRSYRFLGGDRLRLSAEAGDSTLVLNWKRR